MGRFLILILLFIGCGPKIDRITNTEPDKQIKIQIEAARTYGPSTFSPQEYKLPSGIYQLPPMLLANGNAGTGWASITIGTIRYCYQGDAPNNNTESTRFILKGRGSSNIECFSQTLKHSDGVFVTDTVTIVVAVHGGGCGTKCKDTAIISNIDGRLD